MFGNKTKKVNLLLFGELVVPLTNALKLYQFPLCSERVPFPVSVKLFTFQFFNLLGVGYGVFAKQVLTNWIGVLRLYYCYIGFLLHFCRLEGAVIDSFYFSLKLLLFSIRLLKLLVP